MLQRLTFTVAAAALVLSAQPPFPPHGGAPRFLGAEAGMPGRVVKNAPYSADMITETSQTLPDGNRIHQTITVHVYRDSEGRTRTEQPLSALGALAPGSKLPTVIFIHDPVAGANYALNPGNKTVTKSGWRQMGGRGGPRGPREGHQETLPKQTIEGLPAEGTRITQTIAAGEIGNEKPIESTIERWYSPDLQINVLVKQSDPRMGETVTKVVNINRSEPAKSLFEVPADYKQNNIEERNPRPISRR